MDRRSWTLLLMLAAIWGASYLLIKIAVRDLSPAMVAWVRIALATAVLIPVAARQGAFRFPRAGVVWLAVMGLAQVAAPFLLIGLAEEEIASGLAGTLVAAAPLFTALLAIRLDAGERSTGLRLAGVLVGLAGVALLLGVDLGGSGPELLGGLAVLLAALGYAIGGFIAKRHFAEVPPVGLAAWVTAASAILLLPVAAPTFPSEAPSIGPAASVVALGVVGTGIAFAIFYDLIGRVGPARTLVVTYLAPGFAVAYGAVFLDEAITAAILAGLALILGGSWLAAGGGVGRRTRAGPVPVAPPEATAAELPD